MQLSHGEPYSPPNYNKYTITACFIVMRCNIHISLCAASKKAVLAGPLRLFLSDTAASAAGYACLIGSSLSHVGSPAAPPRIMW